MDGSLVTAAAAAAAQGPLALWRARVEGGLLADDAAQERAAARLDALWRALDGYRPVVTPATERRSGGWLARLGRKEEPAAVRPRGLYLVGEVGRGKSMLMDLFFETAPVAAKKRIHFHRFMQDVHARLHALKRELPGASDPIPPLAGAIAREATLLCFDEFQINDIADALILGRLFEALFGRGVVVVATSNTRIENLFQGRPGADAFRPFIAILQRTLDTFELQAERDYRRRRELDGGTWFVPADAAADAAMEAAFAALTGGEEGRPETVMVTGRRVSVPMAAAGVARFEFRALCAAFLGAGDYLEIARRYHTVLIEHVPRLGPESFDVARRFIVLVDALYEARVKLVASAEASPDSLYEQGEGADAFARTASRLAEMQSVAYRALPHTQ